MLPWLRRSTNHYGYSYMYMYMLVAARRLTMFVILCLHSFVLQVVQVEGEAKNVEIPLSQLRELGKKL